MHDFRRKFRRAAGTLASLLKEAQKRGCRKMQGITHSRVIFGYSPPISVDRVTGAPDCVAIARRQDAKKPLRDR